MNRRTVFKHLAVASAAAWLLPSCVSDPKKVSVALNHLQVTGDEEALLADIADVMIPATDTPGALAVKAHLFTLVMVDDCLSKSDQEKYLRGMRTFRDELKSVTGRSFASASPEERFEMLTAFEEQQHLPGEETQFFYNNTRAYVLEGYLSSQHFLTEVKPYQLVPGPSFSGCAPVRVDSKTIS
jgi:hypothetical protein